MVENDLNRCNTNITSSKFKSIQLLSVKSLLRQQQKQQQQQDYENGRDQFVDNTYLIQAAAELLSRQWQRGGNTDDYYNKITVSGDSNCLPASYLLVGIKVDEVNTETEENHTTTGHRNNDYNNQQQLVLLGHGRLIECYESLAGRAAAATYIVIHELYRKQQYGTMLMTLLEQQSIQLGYHYMYLWTQTAILFYIQLGYSTTHRVSLYKSCLKPLKTEQVTLLEDMLRSKLQLSFTCPKQQQKQKQQQDEGNKSQIGHKSKSSRLEDTQKSNSSNTNIKRTETIMLLPSNDNDDDIVSSSTATTTKNDDVWLRKRLVEQINVDTIIPIEERIIEIKNGIESYLNRTQKKNANTEHILNSKNNNSNTNVWKYYLVNVPWQQQVGPSCGLAALRMIRDYYYFYCDENITNVYGFSHTTSSSSINTTTDNCSKVPLQENNNIIKFASLLTVAKDLGYTDDGEIFDANNLVRLVSNSSDGGEEESTTGTTNDCCGDFISCEMKSFQSITPLDVLQCLLSSISTSETTATPPTTKENMNDCTYTDGLYIIPYDTHKIAKLPCCNTGLSAHYGIIVGIVFCADNNNKSNKNTINNDKNDNDDTGVVLEQIDTTTTSTDGLINNNTNDNVLLLVQHGLSSKLSIASWNEFFISNQQLISYDTTKYDKVTKLDLKDRIVQFYHRRIKTNVIIS